MKILIAVPTFETVSVETFKSIYNLDTADYEVAFECIKGYDCAKARNDIAKKAIDNDFDYVLMVDSDIILPEDTLQKMLEGQKDVVLGCYPHRNTKTREVELFKPKQPNFVERFKYNELSHAPHILVKGGGFGCALVKVDVFKKLKFPWFKYCVYDNGHILSEDLYFCHEANANGIHIYGDTRVRCGHLQKYFQFD